MRKRAEQAWRMRWGAILSCTTARAVASSLLNVQSAVGADGDTPQRMRWSGTSVVLVWSRDFLFFLRQE